MEKLLQELRRLQTRVERDRALIAKAVCGTSSDVRLLNSKRLFEQLDERLSMTVEPLMQYAIRHPMEKLSQANVVTVSSHVLTHAFQRGPESDSVILQQVLERMWSTHPSEYPHYSNPMA